MPLPKSVSASSQADAAPTALCDNAPMQRTSETIAPAHQPVSTQLRWGLLFASLIGSVGTYTAINYTMAADAMARELPVALDHIVPFYAPSVVVYLGIYALAVVPVCIVDDRRVLLRGAGAYATLLACGVPFWLLWPVTVPRSPIPVTDLWTWGVALMRWVDPPLNCFPSMHVGETVLAALLCWRLDRGVAVVVGILAAMVWWSTLALDQHWFVDGLSGAVFAVGAYFLWFRARPLPTTAWRTRSRWFLLGAVALYILQFAAAALPWLSGVATAADVGAVAG